MQPSRWQQLHIDPWLCLFLFLNALLGLTVLYSASAQDVGLVSKQAMSFGIGFLVMISLAQIPPKVYQAFSPYFYLFGLFSLIGVMVLVKFAWVRSAGSIFRVRECSTQRIYENWHANDGCMVLARKPLLLASRRLFFL